MPRYKYALVACARWEEAYIQEWLAYHQSIGFDHVYLYSNDDDPTALAKVVAPYLHGPDPFVTLRHWPQVGEQVAIYLHFLETFREETEWFSFLDIDEFFVLKGVDDVYRFMQDYHASTDCLTFNWVAYGHAWKLQRDDAPVLGSHLWRAEGPADATKMLCRSRLVTADLVRAGHGQGRGAFWHFLDNYRLPGLRCRDVLYQPTDGYSARLPESPRAFVDRPGFRQGVLDRAYIAHVQFKSEDDFLRRWRRGGFDNGEHWRALFESGRYRAVLAEGNRVYDTYLAAYWYRYVRDGMRMGNAPADPAQPYPNLALNKPSWQSSVFRPDGPVPPGSRVSGGGNNGLRTGSYGFHTLPEPRPWWIVDLLAAHRVAAIHIYNRHHTADSTVLSAALDVLGSADGATWTTLFANPGTAFGQDGTPLVVRPASGTLCRFVMVRLRTGGTLHLDEIEVYGDPEPVAAPLAATSLSPDALKTVG